MSVTTTMFKEEGFKAFYKGIFPRVLRVGPGQAVVFVCVAAPTLPAPSGAQLKPPTLPFPQRLRARQDRHRPDEVGHLGFGGLVRGVMRPRRPSFPCTQRLPAPLPLVVALPLPYLFVRLQREGKRSSLCAGAGQQGVA
jgi:hypothetical protein